MRVPRRTPERFEMEVFKFGFRHWKKYLPLDILTKLMSIIALTADMLIPLITAMFINYVIQSHPPKEGEFFGFLLTGKYGEIHTMRLFWTLATVFISLLLFKDIIVYLKNLTLQKLGLGLETDLRKVTFDKLMKLDSETLSEYNTGELLTTLNSDTIMFKEMFCRMIPNIFESILTLILAIVMLSTMNKLLLIIPLILTPFFTVALLRFRKQARKNFRNIRGKNSHMSLAVQENIEAVRLVRSFTNENVEKQKFDEANVALKDAHIEQIKLSSTFEAIFSIVRQIAYIGSVAVVAVLIIQGKLLIGALISCTDYVIRIMNAVTQINNSMFQMQQQLVSGRKMLDFVRCESKIADGSISAETMENVHIQIHKGNLNIQGQQILRDIDLDIPMGKKIGIVGGTGSGKSVLLESLIRVHDLSGGSITMNGTDIRELELDSLREKFAYVFQDVFLFSNTIESNIAYSDPTADDRRVEQAALHAQADGFIRKLTEGYDTIVGERGLGISGGQKQRVSIARALLRNAPVLVLDDSTSALDVNTEKRLLKDIKENYPEKTLLISAHRLSSVVDCDEIIYMKNGMILERGGFDELMALDGHFARIYKIQMTQEGSVNFDALADSIAEGRA